MEPDTPSSPLCHVAPPGSDTYCGIPAGTEGVRAYDLCSLPASNDFEGWCSECIAEVKRETFDYASIETRILDDLVVRSLAGSFDGDEGEARAFYTEIKRGVLEEQMERGERDDPSGTYHSWQEAKGTIEATKRAAEELERPVYFTIPTGPLDLGRALHAGLAEHYVGEHTTVSGRFGSRGDYPRTAKEFSAAVRAVEQGRDWRRNSDEVKRQRKLVGADLVQGGPDPCRIMDPLESYNRVDANLVFHVLFGHSNVLDISPEDDPSEENPDE